MLDNYLIAQALGWNWDLGTILLLSGIEIGFVLLIIIIFILIKVWTE